VTGREALTLALEALVALVRDAYPNSWSLIEIAEAGPPNVTDEHVAAIAALAGFGCEFLARRLDDLVPEIMEVEIAEDVDPIRRESPT
jgi:hypothetical protein